MTHYWYVFLISLPIVYYLYKKHQDAEARQKLIKEQQEFEKEQNREKKKEERYLNDLKKLESKYQKNYERLEKEYQRKFEQYREYLEREFWKRWNEYKSGNYDFDEVFEEESEEKQAQESKIFDTAKNYYDVLQVSKNATIEQIKKQFRKLILQYHPDRNKSPEANEICIDLYEAYETLSDPDKRAQYDEYVYSNR